MLVKKIARVVYNNNLLGGAKPGEVAKRLQRLYSLTRKRV